MESKEGTAIKNINLPTKTVEPKNIADDNNRQRKYSPNDNNKHTDKVEDQSPGVNKTKREQYYDVKDNNAASTSSMFSKNSNVTSAEGTCPPPDEVMNPVDIIISCSDHTKEHEISSIGPKKVKCFRAETMNAMRSRPMETYRRPGYCITILGLSLTFIGIPLVIISQSSTNDNTIAGIACIVVGGVTFLSGFLYQHFVHKQRKQLSASAGTLQSTTCA